MMIRQCYRYSTLFWLRCRLYSTIYCRLFLIIMSSMLPFVMTHLKMPGSHACRTDVPGTHFDHIIKIRLFFSLFFFLHFYFFFFLSFTLPFYFSVTLGLFPPPIQNQRGVSFPRIQETRLNRLIRPICSPVALGRPTSATPSCSTRGSLGSIHLSLFILSGSRCCVARPFTIQTVFFVTSSCLSILL